MCYIITGPGLRQPFTMTNLVGMRYRSAFRVVKGYSYSKIVNSIVDSCNTYLVLVNSIFPDIYEPY